VHCNPITRFDPWGLKTTFYKEVAIPDSIGKEVVPYEPSKEQLANFNNAMEMLRDEGGDLGTAMYNAANSKGEGAFDLKVIHSVDSGGTSGIKDGKNAGSVGFNMDEKSLITPEDILDAPADALSSSAAVTAGHEFGHAMIGLSDPMNVTAVENPLRESTDDPKGPRKEYRGVPVPEKPSPEAAQAVDDFIKQWVDKTPTGDDTDDTE
jgi:hypothetical protein